MRVLMTLLILGSVFCVFSAISGIQSFYTDSRTSTVITYWDGYWRLLALAYAAIFAIAFYGIYRRLAIAWKLGWVFLVAGVADFIFEAWGGVSPLKAAQPLPSNLFTAARVRC
jgi:hypothetical protein